VRAAAANIGRSRKPVTKAILGTASLVSETFPFEAARGFLE